jgi:phosphatidylglycerophosphatase A
MQLNDNHVFLRMEPEEMSRTTFCLWLAHLGGLGRVPFAPGTVATVVAGIPVAFLLGGTSIHWALVVVSALVLASCYVSEVAERKANRIDPQEIVIDELAGYLVTVIGFPPDWKTIILGLLLFRIFDILKPWPVSLLNRKTPGGIWVVLDDVGAGVCAHIILWIILAAWP